MISSLFFLIRAIGPWFVTLFLAAMLFTPDGAGDPPWVVLLLCAAAMAIVIVDTFSHLRRVRLIAGKVNASTLSNRQRRQIEVPFEAGEAFDLLDAAIRELPGVEEVHSARDSLQVRAKLRRIDPYGGHHRYSPMRWLGSMRNQILATVAPGDGVGSVTLICEPEAGAWSDWYRVDHGTNLENAEAVTRAITRRVAERRRNETNAARQTVTEKELTVAKLSLLHAQVEPHFLYNTLASAQYLTRSDPALADQMLGNLITYLRHSLPRTDDTLSTLGEELDRARAYLDILKIRMGPRLGLQIDVPAHLLDMPFPPMMLQTLIENAIKHGLEPRTGGGTVWILAKEADGRVLVTVADNGLGFTEQGGGTGIGLRNVRERLRLAYGPDANFAIVANFPDGVAATITLPAHATAADAGAVDARTAPGNATVSPAAEVATHD